MTGEDLRAHLAHLDIAKQEFSNVIGVTRRALDMWLSNTRAVPGPVAAYVNLLLMSPGEVTRIKMKRLDRHDQIHR